MERIVQLRPTIVILDLSVPGCGSKDLFIHIHERVTTTRLLLMTSRLDSRPAFVGANSAIAGLLHKSSGPDELRIAIRAAVRGELYVTPAFAKRVLVPNFDLEWPQLTRRQQQIIALIVLGKSNKEIAAACGIGVRTVESHRAAVMQRLKVHNVAGLIRYAVQYSITGVVPQASATEPSDLRTSTEPHRHSSVVPRKRRR